jgi:hypothetical protein
MKRFLILMTVVFAGVISCTKDKIDDPVIYEFSATPTTLPSRDTVTFTINAFGDNITFYDGKTLISYEADDMPVTHKVGRIRFRITPPADTVYASLTVVNAYDKDNIKEVSREIEIILLDEE